MALLHLIWSLLPIPIGMFCIFMAWRVPFKENQDEPTTDEDLIKPTDAQLGRFFDDDFVEPMEQQRSFYFVILFTGLGIGAILTGLGTFHESMALAGRIVFFLTIASSLIAPLFVYKKAQDAFEKNEKTSSDGEETETETETETNTETDKN